MCNAVHTSEDSNTQDSRVFIWRGKDSLLLLWEERVLILPFNGARALSLLLPFLPFFLFLFLPFLLISCFFFLLFLCYLSLSFSLLAHAFSLYFRLIATRATISHRFWLYITRLCIYLLDFFTSCVHL